MKQTRYVVFIVTNSALNEKHETKNLQGNNKLARGFCISGAAMYYSKLSWKIASRAIFKVLCVLICAS